MNEQMECMCLQCGISVHFDLDLISFEEMPGIDMKLIKNIFCTECGGTLGLIGTAGREPSYKLA